MSELSKRIMGRFYRLAQGDPGWLPWHRSEPSPLLGSAVDALGGGGRALDVGCGSGGCSVWLAQRGLDVTGIDLFPEAIEMARTGADAAGVRVDFLAVDLFLYQPGERFDLVFDFGCLHSLVGGSVTACRTQLHRWLAPRGTFVLEHWGKRHLLDWRPGGPRRRSSAAIQRLFSPELRLDDAEATDFAAPLPSGVNGARHGVPLPSAVRPDRTAIAVIAYCRLRPSALAPAQAQ